MQEILLNKKYFERGLSKSLKKLTLFFLSNPEPFNGQNYQKQKGLRTSDQSLFRLRKKLRKIPLLVVCYLTKFNDEYKVVFELLQKLHLPNYANQFMAP